MIQVIIYNEINVACFQEKWGSNISFSYITQIKYRFDFWLSQAKEATDIFIWNYQITTVFLFFVFFFGPLQFFVLLSKIFTKFSKEERNTLI